MSAVKFDPDASWRITWAGMIDAEKMQFLDFEDQQWIRCDDPVLLAFITTAYRRAVTHVYERVAFGHTVLVGSQPPVRCKHRLLVLKNGDIIRQVVKFNDFGWENAIHKKAYDAVARKGIDPHSQLWGGRRCEVTRKRYVQHRLIEGRIEVDQLPPDNECVFPVDMVWPPA